MPVFARYIGIDYSGAQRPTASLRGLRVYLVERDAPPVEIAPPPPPRKYWSRPGIAEWPVERLAEETPTLVGIDHGFSFPGSRPPQDTVRLISHSALRLSRSR